MAGKPLWQSLGLLTLIKPPVLWVVYNLDGKISEDFWQTHTQKWIADKEELSLKLVSAQRADAHYLENANFILELAKNAALWFKNGNPEKKRRVLDILLSNCSYKDGNIDVELKSAFGVLLENVKTRSWHHLPDMFRKGEVAIIVRLTSIQTVYSSFKITPEIY